MISPKSRSPEPPSDTMLEKPIRFGVAQSSIAVHTAPDWDTRPSDPGSAAPRAKVAFSPSAGRAMPRQLGPTRRTPQRRAFSSSARSSFAPSAPTSEKPAVITTAERTPAFPHSSITSGTVLAGVATTARSTRAGILATEGKQGTPLTAGYFGLTAYSAPR